MISGKWRLQRSKHSPGWTVIGVEQPLGVLVKTDMPDYVALKVPGHSYWSGVGMPRSHAPGEWQVYRVLSRSQDGNTLSVETVCTLPLRISEETRI